MILKTFFTFLFFLHGNILLAGITPKVKNHQYITSADRPADSLKLDSMMRKQLFKFHNGVFEGPGWDFLLKEIKNTQFLSIGEQHGEAEIPMFTGKLAEVFKPKALVVEIDPYTAIQLKETSLNPAKYAEHFKKYPYDFSFYSWETEMALARQMQSNKIDIWGLNEINFLSVGRFFHMLAAQAKLPANRKKAMETGNAYNKNDYPILHDVKKFNELSANKITVSQVDSLLFDFRNENQLSKDMLNNLKLSIQTFNGRSYKKRINLMKKNLLDYLRPYLIKPGDSMPKLLFKFGANHVARTNDVTGYFEVGNLADHLIDAENKKSLHVLIFGKKGTINVMVPLDNNVAIQPYLVDKDPDLLMFKPFTDQLKDGEWASIDLRPVRRAMAQGKLAVGNSRLQDFIKSFDILVLFSETTGNRFIE